MIELISNINYLILIYFTLMTIGYSLLMIFSFPNIFKQFREVRFSNIEHFINKNQILPIGIIMAIFNEKENAFEAILSVLNGYYKNVQLILVNDGSTDNTLELLIKRFELYEVPLIVRQVKPTATMKHMYRSNLYPNLILIDKEHSNIGDTLNVGLNACTAPLYATVDADTLLDPEALSRVLFSMMSLPHSIVVGGCVYVLNENKSKDGRLLETKVPRHFIPGFQCIEYLRSFLFGRTGWNHLGGALSFAGAYTFFEKQAVVEAGFYDSDNFAQDAEIVIRLHEYMRKNKFPYRIYYTPSSFAWTMVPSKLKRFWIQRNHWQRGLLRSFLLHKKLFLNPKYGVVGLLSYPFYILFEILSPLVECISFIFFLICWHLHLIDTKLLILLLILAWGYISFLSVAAIFLNIITFNRYHSFFDTIRLLFLVTIEMLGFRQFRVICYFTATIHYIFNKFLGKNL